MTKLLVLIILVVAGTLSYDTEIRASLLNLVGIVKTVVDDAADNLCNDGEQCSRNDILPPLFIDDMNTNPIDKSLVLKNPKYKKDEPSHSPPPEDTPAPEATLEDKKVPWYDFQEQFGKQLVGNQYLNIQPEIPEHSLLPSVTPAPEAAPDNNKVPWSEFIKQYGN